MNKKSKLAQNTKKMFCQKRIDHLAKFYFDDKIIDGFVAAELVKPPSYLREI